MRGIIILSLLWLSILSMLVYDVRQRMEVLETPLDLSVTPRDLPKVEKLEDK